MEGYKRGSHTVWDCKDHVVWTTKYRFAVLGGDVGDRCRELIRETARAHEMVIHAGAINRDHVHMLLSIPPSLSVSRAVQYLTGRSSHKLLSESGYCASVIGASAYGEEDIGSPAAATLPMRYGPSISRIRQHQSRTMTSRSLDPHPPSESADGRTKSGFKP